MRLFHLLALVPVAFARGAQRYLETGVAAQEFVNTAVARTVELGGSTTLVTTQYKVKALTDDPGPYILALGANGQSEPAWYEVMVGDKAVAGVELDRLGE